MDHYKAIQNALRPKQHDNSTLLVSFNKSHTLPAGAAAIAFLAIAPTPN